MLRTGIQLCMKTVACGVTKPHTVRLMKKENLLLKMQPTRNTSFYNKLTQEELWKGIVSVSNAGRKRGRGKGGDKRTKRNLNFGKNLGEGEIRMIWPGLNRPVLKEGKICRLKPNPEVSPIASVINKKMSFKKFQKVHPLDRGWCGRHPAGRKIPPVNDEDFKNYQSIVLQFKVSTQMTAILGRKRKLFSIVGTGNGNGLIGLGSAKAVDGTSSINLAKKKSAKRLIHIDLIEKHTVNHDFFSEYGRTKITVYKKPEGYGIKAHRIIVSLCELIGIRNLHAKIEGAKNPKHIIRAFIVGLRRQKTYQQIADERKLHLVEFREETHNFPKVLASPEQCLTPVEARRDKISFHEYIMGGKHVYYPEPKVPFYKKLPGWSVHLKRTLFYRNHDKVKLQLLAKYGYYHSYLTKIYPECTGYSTTTKKQEESSEE